MGAGLGFEEAGGDLREVLHVGSEDDRAAGGGGFDRVLSAHPMEALPDEDDVRVRVEVAEFAGAVDEQALGTSGFGFGGEIDFAPVDVVHAAAGELAADGAGAFEMAGNQDEVDVGVFFAKAGENLGEGGFFPVVGASGEDDPGVVGMPAWRRRRGTSSGRESPAMLGSNLRLPTA